jgi:hypothetical protein
MENFSAKTFAKAIIFAKTFAKTKLFAKNIEKTNFLAKNIAKTKIFVSFFREKPKQFFAKIRKRKY